MTKILLVDDLHWPFHGEPFLYAEDGYREYNIDPFPAYHHDIDVVQKALVQVLDNCTLEIPPHHIYVLGYDTTSRTNGWASAGFEKGKLAAGSITLAGKRIPLHPAMTRYLVGHEYGHHADYDICYRQFDRETDSFDDEYAALRGFTHEYKRYGGGAWHTNVGEFIANDFRILVAGIEKDFWPHPGFDRPEKVKGLEAWWREHLL